MSKMLMLIAELQTTPEAQQLANFVKDGFRLESWLALRDVGSVYEARIFALRHPDHPAGVEPVLYSHVVLSTTYEGPADTYQRNFWVRLAPFFLMVAFAVKDAPFEFKDLDDGQKAAFLACRAIIGKADEAKTPAEQADVQAKFKTATQQLATELDREEDAKAQGIIQKSKFDLFTEWVNRNDLGFTIGSPTTSAALLGRDFRIPPSGNERSQFINPKLPRPPFPELV